MDSILLGDGIAQVDVTLHRLGSDLILVLDQGATQLTVVGHFSGTAGQIESIQFADSTVWDANVIAARTAAGTANAMIGTAGNDVFVVDHAGDTITEGIDQGIDTAQASVHYSLGAMSRT